MKRFALAGCALFVAAALLYPVAHRSHKPLPSPAEGQFEERSGVMSQPAPPPGRPTHEPSPDAGPVEPGPAEMPRSGGGAPVPEESAIAMASPLPASLRGTEVDGKLSTDVGGRFAASRDTRTFFDYFLSASGEEPDSLLRSRIVQAIHARLPARAASEAVALLDRYLLYRDRVRRLVADEAQTADPELRFRRLQELRRELLGPAVADAFFGQEEREEIFALDAQRVQGESAGEERKRRLRELERELPREDRRARAEATAPLRLLEEEKTLGQSGIKSEALRQERETRWGPEVADRLEKLEQAHAEWTRRLQEFRSARTALLQDPTHGPDERSAAIAEILSRDFTPQERSRVLALDRIEKERLAQPAPTP